MSGFKQNMRVSRGEVDACDWGNIKDYTDCPELLDDKDSVWEGSSFLNDLSLKKHAW